MTANGCPCESCDDPHAVSNRPGLDTIAYRVDDFAGFRRALLRPLADEQALLGWRPSPGDLGLQLLEWWAYLADVLTFYNERIANEDYLRSAELPASVAGLVGLLGYTPRPAIAAVGKVAAVRSPAQPHEPLAIPAGVQLASEATPGVPVQTFETAAAAFEGGSDTPVVLDPTPALLRHESAGVGSVLLRGSIAGLKSGDDLLILPRDITAAESSWASVTVTSTTTEADPNGGTNTRVMLDSPDLYAAWELGGFTAAEARLVRWAQTATLWNQTSDSALQSLASGDLQVRLSTVVRGISPGDLVFVDDDQGGYALGPVRATNDEYLSIPYPNPGITPAPPNIPLLHTVLTIAQPQRLWLFELLAPPPTGLTLRYGFRDVGALIGSPVTTFTSLPATAHPSAAVAVPAGGTPAFVADATGAGIPVTVTAADGTLSLTASDDTPSTFSLAAPLTLLVDLVDVSRGATVADEQLGTGDASTGGQTFTLAKSPLTYLANGAGWKSTLAISVDGVYWAETPTFYDAAPDARVFVVSQAPDGKSAVRFGDGVNGARLPTGSAVIATYRYGAGAARPPAGRLTTILTPQQNLVSVRNPVAVWGGADAQQAHDVRRNAPASVLTFGRAISADDYETVASLTPGVGRARAYWTWDADHQRSLVKVYVGDDMGAATSARSALAGADDPNRPVAVVQATPVELTVTCTLALAQDRVAGDVVAAATTALALLFTPEQMAIGAPLYSSEVEAALFVAGVDAVHGLGVAVSGVDVFTSEPVGWADPGEGGFFVLAATAISSVVADG
jgi:predicted phage baseplate assembly protein